MAFYLMQAAYNAHGWAALTRNPHNRLEALHPAVERLGGRITNGWMQFGDFDVLFICDMPDNVSAAALSMAISSGGAVRNCRTTPLITFDDGVAALGRATEAEYQPPESEFPYFGA